ncbi:MAG: tetratricopeptide repeat protein [Spirochaetes bacterium]|nr:tetratricopeptide repeat protein [Spirochaetota bacterium]
MKKTIIPAIIITLIIVCSFLIGQEQSIRVAIAPFDDTPAMEAISPSATDSLTQLLSNNKHITIRQPNAIQSYLNLLEKVQIGIEDPTVLKGKADMLQIDYLVVGSIGKILDRYEVDARMVDIQSWKIVSTCGVEADGLNNGVSKVADYFSSLTFSQIQQYLEHTKDTPTVGIQEFREFFENPPTALYCATFMEMLTSALADKTKNSIIESKFTSRLLEEKSLEMAGIIENSKADQLFTIHGIEYRIIGNIRVFPDLIVVNYGIINSSNQKIIFTGSVDAVTPNSLRAIASHIAKTIDDALNNKIANLLITTEPVDAEIYINDTFAGTTKNKKLMAIAQKGKNVVTAKAEGCKAATVEIDCKPRITNTVRIRIERITERLLQEAMVFESNGQYTKAIERYNEFVKETGNTTEANVALYRIGHILLKNIQDYEKAKHIFTQLLNNYPEPLIRSEGYFGLAQTYLAMGNKELAKSTINYLLQYYPQSNAAQEAKELLKTLDNK